MHSRVDREELANLGLIGEWKNHALAGWLLGWCLAATGTERWKILGGGVSFQRAVLSDCDRV